jgi:Peptidase propeptide and YPEB domain
VNARKVLIGAAVALVLLVGAGVAYANGSSGDGPEQSTGPGMERAKSVALEQVNGRVSATEFQDEEGYYEVEVTREDGSQVDVHLDKNYNVLNTPDDHEGADKSEEAPNDDGG